MMDGYSTDNNYNDVSVSSIAKSELMASISREINTPLNVISSMITMLKSTTLISDQKDYLDMIESSSLLLSDLVRELLNASIIETGKLSFNHTPFNVKTTIEALIGQIELEAKKKDIELRLQLDETIPKILSGDSKRFSQIFINIISNAFKLTEIGYVQVNIKLNKIIDDKVELYCCIEDSGVGISEDRIRRLFCSGSELSLGVMISKILIEQMFGTLSINSREGEGTEFSFTCQLDNISSDGREETERTIDQNTFDRDMLLKKLNNNYELYNKIVEVFFKETSQKLGELKTAVKLMDYEKIISISHSIKGAAGNITASKMQECAKNLEFAGKDREATNIDKLFEELSNEFKKLKDEDISIL